MDDAIDTADIVVRLQRAFLLVHESMDMFRHDPPLAISADKLLLSAIQEIEDARADPKCLALKIMLLDDCSLDDSAI